MKSEVATTRIGETWLEEDGILRFIVSTSGVKMNRQDAEEALDAIVQVSKGTTYPVIVDIRKLLGMDIDSRRFFANTITVTACVLLVESPVSRVIGNFFIGLNKASIPVKLFRDENKAIDWLAEFKTA